MINLNRTATPCPTRWPQLAPAILRSAVGSAEMVQQPLQRVRPEFLVAGAAAGGGAAPAGRVAGEAGEAAGWGW